MALTVTGITISAEFADKEYGNGQESFMNMSAKCPAPEGIPLENLDAVIVDGLDMYFACWQTLLASRYATGQINPDEFNKRLEASNKRLKMIRNFYKKEVANSE
jgi:hypothetical protein